jgi:glyoxylase-like metal-dependent hydrolase (beta-lactamase superfamily II)
LHLPGHSSGSIGLLDTRTRQFFSGDVVYDGQLLDELEDSAIDDYLDSMARLLQLETDEVRPGHYASFDRRRLRELVRGYLDTRKAPRCPSEK